MTSDNTMPVEVVAIDSEDDEPTIDMNSGKPIIQLFRRLISSDDKQNTVLTNAQIVDILHKEFDINIAQLHELEGDIYLTIVKKCLKDWPCWDEFDKTVNNLKIQNNQKGINTFLQSNYVNLKEHLRVMLDSSREGAHKTALEVVKLNKHKNKSKNEESDKNVVLEVYASRAQLNQLIYQHPTFNNNIFNSILSTPSQICVNVLPLEAILNWWDVSICILSVNNVWFYKRDTKHELKHVLINRNLLSQFNPLKVLDQNVKTNSTTNTVNANREDLLSSIDGLYESFPKCKELLDFIKKDIMLMPETVYVRSSYQRYTNKYPYVRYLYKEIDKVDDRLKKYDLQLEETVSPKYETYVGQVHKHYKDLVVKCLACKCVFNGKSNLIQELRSHFDGKHIMEPDWKCTNCNKTFTMAKLAENWWTHRC